MPAVLCCAGRVDNAAGVQPVLLPGQAAHEDAGEPQRYPRGGDTTHRLHVCAPGGAGCGWTLGVWEVLGYKTQGRAFFCGLTRFCVLMGS